MSPLFARTPVRRTRDGRFRLHLEPHERDLLRQLGPQLSALLDQPDQPGLARLFPPAYSDPAHSTHEEEYRRLMREDLVAGHREALETLAATAGAVDLSEQQLLGWARALNSVRLVLGTLLDVSEDDEHRDPASAEEAIYGWLSGLLGCAIDAMAGET